MTGDSWETCVSQGHKDCLYRTLRWHNENSVNMFQSPNPTFFQAMHPYNLHINSQHVVFEEAGCITFTLNVIIIFVVCRGCSSFVMCCISPWTLMFKLCSSTTVLKYHSAVYLHLYFHIPSNFSALINTHTGICVRVHMDVHFVSQRYSTSVLALSPNDWNKLQDD